jgi:hypothetical protein
MGRLVEDLFWHDLKNKYCMKVYSFCTPKNKQTSADLLNDNKQGMDQFDIGMYKNKSYLHNVVINQLGERVIFSLVKEIPLFVD